MNIKASLLIGFLFLCLGLNAQSKSDSLIFNVKLLFNNEDFQLSSNYVSIQKDTLSFETVKFYLSDFQLIYNDNSSFKELDSYHLIDVESPETMHFSLSNQKDKEIIALKFNIGIDSLASVSGAMEGDLDATKGMYWAWQSGFIHLKIEGKSSSCTTRKNKFQFHIGGYLEPNYAMRNINIKFNDNDKNQINLVMDLGTLFSKISLKETNTIMIPGKEAMKFADLTTKIFSIE